MIYFKVHLKRSASLITKLFAAFHLIKPVIFVSLSFLSSLVYRNGSWCVTNRDPDGSVRTSVVGKPN